MRTRFRYGRVDLRVYRTAEWWEGSASHTLPCPQPAIAIAYWAAYSGAQSVQYRRRPGRPWWPAVPSQRIST